MTLVHMRSAPKLALMAEPLAKRLAQRLRHELDQSGTTQQQLADTLTVAQSTVSRWLTGRNTVPVEQLEPIARALNVEVADLLGAPWLASEAERTHERAS